MIFLCVGPTCQCIINYLNLIFFLFSKNELAGFFHIHSILTFTLSLHKATLPHLYPFKKNYKCNRLRIMAYIGQINCSLKSSLSTILKYPIFSHRCSHCTEKICSVFWRCRYFFSRWPTINFSPKTRLQHTPRNKWTIHFFLSFGCFFVFLEFIPAIFLVFLQVTYEYKFWKECVAVPLEHIRSLC